MNDFPILDSNKSNFWTNIEHRPNMKRPEGENEMGEQRRTIGFFAHDTACKNTIQVRTSYLEAKKSKSKAGSQGAVVNDSLSQLLVVDMPKISLELCHGMMLMMIFKVKIH
uniref:Uncharacterized protein n=1 Tax=Romanomermis culicivorax TaxID=13658 RepID=A0A915KLE4_ROMCU